MEERKYPNPVVTFLIVYQGKFLLLKRGKAEKNYPNLWAFPGGKVELGETVVETIRREAKEEVGLELENKIGFLDTYTFSSSVGIAFLVQSTTDSVALAPGFQDHVWISSLEELSAYKCISGIYNHLKNALYVLENDLCMNMEETNLLEEKYLNT